MIRASTRLRVTSVLASLLGMLATMTVSRAGGGPVEVGAAVTTTKEAAYSMGFAPAADGAAGKAPKQQEVDPGSKIRTITPERAVAGRLQWHGYIQNREYWPSGARTQYPLERLSLQLRMPFDNKSYLYFEGYYHQWAPKQFVLDSFYCDMPVGDRGLRIGKGRLLTNGIMPVPPNRRTSNYGVVAEAFTQDRVHGAQYTLTEGRLGFGAAVHTSYRLGRRAVGDAHLVGLQALQNCVPHLAFRGIQDQLSTKPSVSARVGAHWGPGPKVGLSAQYGRIDDRDFNALVGTTAALRPKNPFTGVASSAIGPGYTNNTVGQFGLDATYKQKSGFIAQFEGYDAHASNLPDGGRSMLTGYEPARGSKFYCRYGQQLMGIAPTDNPLTWDQGQWSFSVVHPLQKNISLQYELEPSSNHNGSGQRVHDNVFFTELLMMF